jgi:hypothetical protein
MTYGIEGYGLFFACLEIIAGNLTDENITFELEHDSEILAHKFKLDTLKTEEMMKYMVKLGLFEFDIVTGKISCFKLAKHIDSSLIKNPQLLDMKKKIQENSRKVEKTNENSCQIRLDEIRLDKTNKLKKESDSENTEESSKEVIREGNKEISLRTILEERFPEKVESFLELFNRVTEGEDQCIKFFNDRMEYSKSSIIEGIDDVIGRLEKGSIIKVNLKYIGIAIDIARNKEDEVQKTEPRFRQFCLDKLGEIDGMIVYDFYREFFNPKKYWECRQFKSRRDERFTKNINYLVDDFGKDKLLNTIKEFKELDRTGQLKTHDITYFSGAIKKYGKFKGPKEKPKISTEMPVVEPTIFRRARDNAKGDYEIYNWDFKCTCGAIVSKWDQPCPKCHTGLQWHNINMDENGNIIPD